MPSSSPLGENAVVLVDGSGYIFRAFHGLPMMNRPDGTPINAVFGFTKMLMKLMQDLNPSYVAMIFDAGRTTFRNEIYPDYKVTAQNHLKSLSRSSRWSDRQLMR